LPRLERSQQRSLGTTVSLYRVAFAISVPVSPDIVMEPFDWRV